MKTKILLLITFLSANIISYGQICGTPSPLFQAKKTITNSEFLKSSNLICINVYYHIVRENNGTGGYNSNQLDDITNTLNTAFNEHNLYLNNSGFDYIDNSTYYNIDDTGNSTTEFDALVQININPNAINIYIINNATSYAGRANGILSQALVIEKNYANTQVVSHEVGHCLDLWHTFQGTAANTSGCAEAINGSNCSSCGDLVCDTPADANTGNSGGYTPDMDNIMSYYYPFTHFSNGQADRIRQAFASSTILQQVVSNSCNFIEGPEEICTGEFETFSLTVDIPFGASINWEYPNGYMYIISGQGTPNCTFGAFTTGSNLFITATVTYNGNTDIYTKSTNILSGSGSALQTPSIVIAPDNPFNLICCGETYTFRHAICDYNCTNIEWDFTVYYQNPLDYYAFSTFGNSGYITAQKNTYSPLIVNARARNIPEYCGNPSNWSNGITRYYGTVSSNYNNSNFNSELPLKEYFLNKESILYVETLDLYEWLDFKYSDKDLNTDDITNIINFINNEDAFKFLNIQIFNFNGIKVFEDNNHLGENIINFSDFQTGIYFVKFNYGNIINTKTIIKN